MSEDRWALWRPHLGSIEADLRAEVEHALRGTGTRHRRRGTPPGHLPAELAASIAPRVVVYLLDRGWQIRHRTWPPGMVVGKADGQPAWHSMSGYMPARDED